MNVNFLLLPLVLGGSMGAVFLLPTAGQMAQSAVSMKLPDSLGKWTFYNQPASEAELGALARDTEFSKAICTASRPGRYTMFGESEREFIQLSVVLSGSDVNNSIHRPERCMPAQGHNITSSEDRKVTLPNGRHFLLKRLVSIQTLPKDNDAEKKEYQDHNCLTYYFFVGHELVTDSHLFRTFIDMKDRVVHGTDQRWAYVSASMWYGKVPGIDGAVSEGEADTKLQKFLSDFSARQINWDQITTED